MSFQISKNKMTFLADDNHASVVMSNAEDVYVAHDGNQLLDQLDINGQGIYHYLIQAHLYLPGVQDVNLPEVRVISAWSGGSEETVMATSNHISSNSGQSYGWAIRSYKDELTSVRLAIYPNQADRDASSSFTIPANSQIRIGFTPQDAVLNQLSFTGPSPPVTQYYAVMFGSHWPMGYGASGPTGQLHLDKFSDRISEINAALPAGEAKWLLASASTAEKKAAILAFFDQTVADIRAHSDYNGTTGFSGGGSSSGGFALPNGWAGENFTVGDKVYPGAVMYVDISKVSSTWTWGDGTTVDGTYPGDGSWQAYGPSAEHTYASLLGNGAQWGSETVDADAGKLKSVPDDGLRTIAIYERLA